jgi:preprotein translocase subunit SecG
MRKFIDWLFTAISLLCLLYYTNKFYQYRMIFGNMNLYLWFIVVFWIIITLMIGINNSYKLDKLQVQNQELKELIQILSEQSDEQYDSTCNHLQVNREIGLDIYNKLQGGT